MTIQPFIVQIIKAYDSPIPVDSAAALLSLSTLLASVVFICVIRYTGKRFLYLSAVTGTFLCSLVIACYGFVYLPSGYTSFEQQKYKFVLRNKNVAYIPLTCLFLTNFFMFMGVISVVIFWTINLFSILNRTYVIISIFFIISATIISL